MAKAENLYKGIRFQGTCVPQPGDDRCQEEVPARIGEMRMRKNKSVRRWRASSASCMEQKQCAGLPTSTDCLLVHPGGRHRLGWAGHADPGARVDDRDGITDARRGWLMQLEGRGLTLELGDVCRVEGEARVRCRLAGLWRALR
jgi:hypothetical protein